VPTAFVLVGQKNNNNTNICKAHIVSIRAESEAPNAMMLIVKKIKRLATANRSIFEHLCHKILGVFDPVIIFLSSG